MILSMGETYSVLLLRLFKLALSFLLAFPIGWNQEREGSSAGVRTFPLVSLGSCGLILLASAVMKGMLDSQSHVLQGLITGIGFVGGGAILGSERSVHGTATAASIWNMAVIGAAVAYGLYDIGVVLAILNYMTLRFLLPIKREIDRQADTREGSAR